MNLNLIIIFSPHFQVDPTVHWVVGVADHPQAGTGLDLMGVTDLDLMEDLLAHQHLLMEVGHHCYQTHPHGIRYADHPDTMHRPQDRCQFQ